jgi:GTP-binding protein
MTNLAVRVEPGKNADSFKVKGRGTLQLGILMENMRREGFEIMVGAPQVIYRDDPETGATQEPYEEAVCEVPNELQGVVMEEFQKKSAIMKTMESGSGDSTMIMTFEIPTANLIGMQGKLLSRTRGQAVMNSRFSHWGEVQKNNIKLREKGSIINVGNGKASTYSLQNIQARGETFISVGDEVFDGMCIGIHSKEQDMTCNITKEKAVNNTRAGGMGGPSISRAGAAKAMSLDDFLGHMEIDEMLEVTPGPLRLCKKDSKGLKAIK